MGIYSNGIIFGVRIYNFNEKTDFSNILFEKTYKEPMSDEQKAEAYSFYCELHDKDQIVFTIYTECTTTHDLPHKNKPMMMWHPLPLNQFLDHFDI